MTELERTLIANAPKCRPCTNSEITVAQLLSVTHRYTERVKIYVIPFQEGIDAKFKEQDITGNAFQNDTETQRVLKYYANVPVYNLSVEFAETTIKDSNGKATGHGVIATLTAHCSYADIRESYLMEKADTKRAKARAHRKQRKESKES